MEISHIYKLSIKKRDKILKSDDIRKYLLVNNLITKCVIFENIKREEKWFETCLDKLNQLNLQK